MSGWRVWIAFDRDPPPRNRDAALWRALAEACRLPDGKIDALEMDRWIDVLVWYRRGDA